MKFAFRALGVCALSLSSLLLAGCLPSEPGNSQTSQQPQGGEQSARQITPEQLVNTLKVMSTKPDEYSDTIDRHILTEELAKRGPTALMPLIEYMGAPDTEQDARLFILQCVHKYMSPAYLPAIEKQLHSEDIVVRASAVMCLGNIEDERVPGLLREALEDPSARVRFSALSGLALHGDEEARSELKAMYTEDATMGDIPVSQVKREVVRMLLQEPRKEDLPILEDALEQDFLEINHRSMIAQTLGRMGETRHIAMLKKSVSLQEEPVYGEIVQDAIAAIKERGGQA